MGETITVWHVFQFCGFFLSVVVMPLFIVRYGKKAGERSITAAEEIVAMRQEQKADTVLIRAEQKADIELLRREQKADINGLYDKLDAHHSALVLEFNNFCAPRQAGCNKVIMSEIAHAKEISSTVCKKLEEVKVDRKSKWDRQEDLNRTFLTKIGSDKR